MDKGSDSTHEAGEEDTVQRLQHFGAAKLSNWKNCLAMPVQRRLEEVAAAAVDDRPSLRMHNSEEAAADNACEGVSQAGEHWDCWWPVVTPNYY